MAKKENVLEMKIPGILPLMNLRDPMDPILLAKLNNGPTCIPELNGLCSSLKKSEALFKKKPKCHQFHKQKLNVMPCHLVKVNKKDNKNSEENIKEKVNETEIYEEPTIFKKECIEVRAPETTIIKDCVITEVEPKQETVEGKTEEKIEDNEEKTTQNTKEDLTISDIVSQ